jgi:hypothetical protein
VLGLKGKTLSATSFAHVPMNKSWKRSRFQPNPLKATTPHHLVTLRIVKGKKVDFKENL